MTRKTVTITTPDYPEARQFHLEEAKAERFAARIRSEGGTAIISTLGLGAELASRLLKSGINLSDVR